MHSYTDTEYSVPPIQQIEWLAGAKKKYYTATTKFRMPLVLSSPFKPELTQFHFPTCDAQRSHLVIVNSHFREPSPP